MSTPAVFLDRDGTINEEVGFIDRAARLVLLPHSLEAIRLFNSAGLKAVVISNQSGIARGYFEPRTVDDIQARLEALLSEGGAHLDGFYYCPHGPEDSCLCRKPRPGLIEKATRELDLDLDKSYLVGDRYRDLEAGANCGVKGILVLTGYGAEEHQQFAGTGRVQPVYVARDLLDAARWILADLQRDV